MKFVALFKDKKFKVTA